MSVKPPDHPAASAETGDLKPLLARIAAGGSLSEAESERAFSIMMAGDATPAQMGGFLLGMRVRGETVEELTGAVRAIRAKALTVTAPPGAIDTCGTGGDGSGTFNISTAAALVTAACGVPVAKHGNRSLSSRSGSADVLAALGVNIDADPAIAERALREVGFGFLMAPRYHRAMHHVAQTRVELGTRTIFNLLGPLLSPAEAKFQLIGVYAPHWLEPVAEVLGKLGSERAWIVHGQGLDELTTTGVTEVAELRHGTVTRFEVTPEEAGLHRARIEDLKGGDAAENAAIMHRILAGEHGPMRDIVLLNAGAALLVAGKADYLREGAEIAAKAIDSGAAKRVLERLVAVTKPSE
jgi:anthranilate phosphoribosyltransferase